MTSLSKPVRRLLHKLRDNLLLSGSAIALLSTAFSLIVVANLSLAQLAENHLADVQVAMLSLPRPQSEDIAIVLIDEKTVMKYPYRSPLDRSLISDLLQALQARSVAAIGINVLFDRPTEAHKDQRLYQQLRSTTVPVVLSKVSSSAGFSAEQVRFANEFVGNLRTGLSLIYRDPVDHTVRASLLRQVQGRTVQLGFAATLAAAVGMELPREESIAIDYRLGPDPATPPFPIYAAHEVTDLPVAALENRIVLIGSDLGNASRLRTPLSVLNDGFNNDLPGVVIEAHILSQLIESRSRGIALARDTFLVTLLMAVIGCIVSLIPVTLTIKLLISLALLPLTWLAAFSVYVYQQSTIPMVAPTMAFAFAVVLSAFWEWRSEFNKRERIHHAFGQFLAPAVVEKILLDPDALELGGEVRELSFLFTDLEGFTRLTESTPPKQMVKLVNLYLEEACDVVVDSGGTIDKVVGDALHVMFNAPLAQTDHAARAVACALALDRWSQAFRTRIKVEEGIDLGVTRIGVNTGDCIVGNFGGKRRFDYTAHGDAINTAARLEAINQRLGTRVCVSETTVNQCPDYRFRRVAHLLLRGKTVGLDAYLPVVEGSIDEQLIVQYERAYQALSDNDETADDLFAALEAKYPDDPLVRLHVKRIEAGESGTTLIIRKK